MFLTQYGLGSVALAFTDREGGVSTGPWASLNLGAAGADDAAHVETNLQRVADAIGADCLVRMRQVHGANVHIVESAPGDQSPTVDALVTDQRHVGLLVRVADCLPVVLADPEAGVVAVAHAGRKGMQLGIIAATLEAMKHKGAQQISAWLGPRACGRCYEVPTAMADAVAADVPAARSRTTWGTDALDIGAGVGSQLEAVGVTVHDIGRELCTIEDERLFSYRRQGVESGRFGAVVMLR